MARDPREPIKFIAVEVDDEHYVVNTSGEVRQDARVYLDEYDMGRVRAGYACAVCYEVQDRPFPIKCSVCGFAMQDKQAEFIAKGYRGNVRIGPSTSMDDEAAFMEEWAEIQRIQHRDPILRPSQILLPGHDFQI